MMEFCAGTMSRWMERQCVSSWWSQSLRKGILTEVHEGTTSGHLGEERTRGRLKERFYWPGHWNDVRNWCKTCAVCASRKTLAPKTKAPLQTVKVGSPMQLVAVDILSHCQRVKAGTCTC